MTAAIQQYKQINNQASVEDANAHKLIAMLINGAIDKVSMAKGFMQRDEVSKKGESISLAITIIDGLQSSLDLSQGEIAENLFRLYQYMMEVLLQANLKDNIQQLDEVLGLLQSIKEGWDGIEQQANEILNKS